MEKIVIIVADLGHFKAYRVTQAPRESPRVKLIKSYDSLEGLTKLSDRVSDSAGSFGRGGGREERAKGSGERHNLELETEKKLVKLIAQDIDALIDSEKCSAWYIAAGEKINRRIVEQLRPEIKSRLDKNITATLTKVDKSELLSYFT